MRARLLKLVQLSLICLGITAEAKEVTLKWREIPGAKKYNLEVASNENLSDIVFSKTLKVNNLKHDLKSGIYYMRVQAIYELGRNGLWSKPFKLVVTAPIQAVEESEKPKTVSIRPEKKIDVASNWEVKDKATSYKVSVIKDGKRILYEETTRPEIYFKPTTAGSYQIKVSAGLGKYFGPETIVENINVEEDLTKPSEISIAQGTADASFSQTSHGLPPPVLAVPKYKRWSSKKPVDLKWQPVDEAKDYTISIYKMTDSEESKDLRQPASTSPSKHLVAQYKNVSANGFQVPALPPGRYLTSVAASGLNSSKTSESVYQFEVKKPKVIEFEKLDFSFHYRFNQVKYQTSVIEAGSGQSNADSVGGAVEVEGTFWFPDSDFGLKAASTWGGFLISNMNVTYNELTLKGAYQLAKPEGPIRSDIKTYLGLHAMSFPIVVLNNNSNSNNSGGSSGSSSTVASAPNSVQTFTPTIFGPSFGFDFTKSVSEKFSIISSLFAHIPVSSSNLGSISLNKIDSSVVNGKIGLGASYRIPGNYRLIAMAAFQDDKIRWQASNNNSSGSSSSSSSSAGTSQAEFSMKSVIVGIETSDGDPSMPKSDRFSEVDLTARYIYSPANYSGHFPELPQYYSQAAADNNLSKAFSGTVQIGTDVWFRDSESGFRLSGGWSGITAQGATTSYPEFYGQWGLRPKDQTSKSDWQPRNYLGFRAWVVPHIIPDQNSGGGTSLPQLVGLADTLEISKSLSKRWRSFLNAEISLPAFIANKDTNYESVSLATLNYKAELGASFQFTEEFTATSSFGYKSDQMKYRYVGVDSTSTSSLSAPLYSLGIRYSF